MLVDNLPPGASTWARRSRIDDGWDLHALLLTDLFRALTGQDHPARPKPKGSSRHERLSARLKAQQRRMAAVQRIAENVDAASV